MFVVVVFTVMVSLAVSDSHTSHSNNKDAAGNQDVAKAVAAHFRSEFGLKEGEFLQFIAPSILNCPLIMLTICAFSFCVTACPDRLQYRTSVLSVSL